MGRSWSYRRLLFAAVSLLLLGAATHVYLISSLHSRRFTHLTASNFNASFLTLKLRSHNHHTNSRHPLNTRAVQSVAKHFIHYTGMDSLGGAIETVKGTIKELQYRCEVTEGCIAFTTDGVLKQELLPYNKWSPLTTNDKGLYVLDTDYCSLKKGHTCPVGTICVNELKGRYSCATALAATEWVEPTAVTTVTNSMIQLVISTDCTLLEGLVPLLQSITEHNAKNKMTIYIVTSTKDAKTVEARVGCSIKMPKNIQIRFVTFDIPKSFQQLITIGSHPYLASTANFARFYFDKLFPSLSYILYLDVDTIVLHNISTLWEQVTSNEQLLLVVQRPSPVYGIHFHRNFSTMYKERYGRVINMTSPTFNAGVMGFNLDKWRRNNVTSEVIYWMREHFKNPVLWSQGTQPLLYIVGYQDWSIADSHWNVEGLGWLNIQPKVVESAYILHWNGPDKPWGKQKVSMKYLKNHRSSKFRTGQYQSKWKHYNRQECSRRGTCEKAGVCKCKRGFGGQLCEKKLS